MELKDIKRIEAEGTMMELSKEDRIKGGIILKEVGKNYIERSIPWFKSAEAEMSSGEQMSIPMGSVTYKADMKEKTSHKTVVKEEEFIDVLKKTGHTEYLKEAVDKNKVYKDAASGKLTDPEVLDCFQKIVKVEVEYKEESRGELNYEIIIFKS